MVIELNIIYTYNKDENDFRRLHLLLGAYFDLLLYSFSITYIHIHISKGKRKGAYFGIYNGGSSCSQTFSLWKQVG